MYVCKGTKSQLTSLPWGLSSINDTCTIFSTRVVLSSRIAHAVQNVEIKTLVVSCSMTDAICVFRKTTNWNILWWGWSLFYMEMAKQQLYHMQTKLSAAMFETSGFHRTLHLAYTSVEDTFPLQNSHYLFKWKRNLREIIYSVNWILATQNRSTVGRLWTWPCRSWAINQKILLSSTHFMYF